MMDEYQGEEYVQELWWNEYLERERKRMAYEDGKAEGETIGRLNGYNERNYEIAIKMLKEHEPIEKINIFTSIPLKELSKLSRNKSILSEK